MPTLGKAEASVILCNQCGRRIAIRGIRVQEKKRGEYSVTFFACPHCGKVYQINTMDERQWELFRQRDRAMKQIKAAMGLRFRQKTIKEYRKEAAEIEKKIHRRAERLRAIGEEILEGKSEGEADGTENGNRGAESVQEH